MDLSADTGRRVMIAQPWHLVGEVAAGVRHFDDGGLAERPLYEHRVAAFGGAGEGSPMTATDAARTLQMTPHLPVEVIEASEGPGPDHVIPHSPSALADADGKVLLAYVRTKRRGWAGSSIWLRRSFDGGDTWREAESFLLGDSRIAYAKPAMVRLSDGSIAMTYSEFILDEAGRLPATGNRRRMFVRSQDDGRTWFAPVFMADASSNNDNLIVAQGGRLLQPLVAGHGPTADPLIDIVASDDLGASWKLISRTGARAEARPTGESDFVHVGEGRIVLFSRQKAPSYGLNFSDDNGATWDGPHTLWLGGGDNPPKIGIVPGTGLIVALVHSWNDGARAKDRRQLASVVSADGGRTWDNFRLIGFAPDGSDGFLQHSFTFGGDTAYVFFGGGSRHDTQDGKDLRLIRLHRDFFTSRAPWPYDAHGRPAGGQNNHSPLPQGGETRIIR